MFIFLSGLSFFSSLQKSLEIFCGRLQSKKTAACLKPLFLNITHFTVMFLSKLEQISRPKSVSLTKIV